MSALTRILQVRLNPETDDALTDLTRRTGESKRSIVRRLLVEQLQQVGYAHLPTPAPTRTTFKKETP